MVNWIFPYRHASGPRFQTTRIHPLSPDPTFVEIIWHIDASAMSEDFFHTPTQAKTKATLPPPFTLSLISKCVDKPNQRHNTNDLLLKFDSPLPGDHSANTPSTADSPRHYCQLGGGSASIPGTSVTEDRSGVGGSTDSQHEQSRIVLPPETGEQPVLTLVRLRLE